MLGSILELKTMLKNKRPFIVGLYYGPSFYAVQILEMVVRQRGDRRLTMFYGEISDFPELIKGHTRIPEELILRCDQKLTTIGLTDVEPIY